MSAREIVRERTFTQADFDRFAALSGDDNPIHVDAQASARTRFGRPVAHGMLLNTVLRGLIDELVPGARLHDQALMFPAPTFAGEPMRFSVALARDNGAAATLELDCRRIEDGTVTCTGTATVQYGERDA